MGIGSLVFAACSIKMLLALLTLPLLMLSAVQASLVPALFLFGDTLVDAGNNNRLLTRAKANFPPYGFNFPESEATGRFSDGRLIHDFLASYLGLSFPPAYLGSRNFSQGANFGSASSGIFRWVGNGVVLSLQDQVDLFSDVHRILKEQRGSDENSLLMSQSVFYICTGNQDVGRMLHLRGRLFAALRDQLLHEFGRQMERLYNFGARKFVIVGVSVGCSPSHQSFGLCSVQGMYSSMNFNVGLSRMLSRLRYVMPDAEFVMANLANLLVDIKANPRAYGFTNSVQGCCPLYERSRPCYMDAEFCQVPSEYMFWDSSNPTEAFNRIVAQQWWQGANRYISPINISQLAVTVTIPEAHESAAPSPTSKKDSAPGPGSQFKRKSSASPAPSPVLGAVLPPHHGLAPSPLSRTGRNKNPAPHSKHKAPGPLPRSNHGVAAPAPHSKHRAPGPSRSFKHRVAASPELLPVTSSPEVSRTVRGWSALAPTARVPHFNHTPSHGQLSGPPAPSSLIYDSALSPILATARPPANGNLSPNYQPPEHASTPSSGTYNSVPPPGYSKPASPSKVSPPPEVDDLRFWTAPTTLDHSTHHHPSPPDVSPVISPPPEQTVIPPTPHIASPSQEDSEHTSPAPHTANPPTPSSTDPKHTANPPTPSSEHTSPTPHTANPPTPSSAGPQHTANSPTPSSAGPQHTTNPAAPSSTGPKRIANPPTPLREHRRHSSAAPAPIVHPERFYNPPTPSSAPAPAPAPAPSPFIYQEPSRAPGSEDTLASEPPGPLERA